ncbi:hypothetical protein ACH3VR_00620 [Microbacterium sp. B2969]|uniref:Flagellar biosynthesis protein FlaG n=1 Tax=Microbacterium alkaliflavum TaxID=3248839 RepID=A0ABW7Q216_9MICO
MSTTGNEFERPGVNYPDREDTEGATDTPSEGEPTRDEPTRDEPAAATEETGTPEAPEPTHEAVGVGVIDDGTSVVNPQALGGHQGRDGGRDTMSASQAQKAGALGTEQEQRLPAMSQNNASDIEKVSGIVVQTRADVVDMPFERVVEVLAQRLDQAGVSLPERDVEELARQITTGE